MATKRQLHALNALKVLAIVFVFNSHCDALYPIKALATGGAVGNALFFVISGYLLSIKDQGFVPFIRKKVLQLYPGMVVVTLINVAVGLTPHVTAPASLFSRYVFLTGYWFVGGLLLFNVVIFALERLGAFDNFGAFSLVVWGIYAACYLLFVDKGGWHVEDRGWFRLIYYFYVYAAGYCLKTGRFKLGLSGTPALIAAIIGLVGNMGWKLVLNRFPAAMPSQFLTQVFCVTFALSALAWTLSVEDVYCERVSTKARDIIDHWSGYSLEIYLTQRLAQWVALMTFFPLNLVVAVAITLPYARVLKFVTQPIARLGAAKKSGQA